MNKVRAKNLIRELRRALNLCLNDEGFGPEEKLYARTAYLNLNALRNSLHRYLIKKKT